MREQIKNRPTIASLGEIFDLAESSYNSDAVFDYCKSILESVCKTILIDRGTILDDNTDLPKLAKVALNSLLDNLNSGERVALNKINSGIITTIHGICEMRNNYGLVSHGKDIREEGSVQILRNHVLRVTDVVGSLLIQLHFDSFSSIEGRRLYYENQSDFNDWFDDINGDVPIGGYTFKSSEVLFRNDIVAYKEELNNYNNNPDK